MADTMKAVKMLADLIGGDPQEIIALTASRRAFHWNGLSVLILVRRDWVEMFDDETGETLVSVAVPESGATRLVRRPADGHGKGWSNFTSEPAPLGFYHKNNRIAHFLKR